MEMVQRTKESFCRALDWQIEIAWFDLAGLHKLDGERVAKVELTTRGTSGRYEGFFVTVMNKREGRVDAKFFAFDDYLSPRLEDREDARGDHPLGRGNVCYAVVAHCGFDWHIARPADTRPFTSAVESYLEAFR